MLGSGERVTIRQQCNRWHWCRKPFPIITHHSSAPDWPWCLTYRLVWRVQNKFSPPPSNVVHCCTDVCTGAGLYWQDLWRVSLDERQLLLRSTLTRSHIFIGSVIVVLVKYILVSLVRMLGSGDRVTIRQQCYRWHWCRKLFPKL